MLIRITVVHKEQTGFGNQILSALLIIVPRQFASNADANTVMQQNYAHNSILP